MAGESDTGDAPPLGELPHLDDNILLEVEQGEEAFYDATRVSGGFTVTKPSEQHFIGRRLWIRVAALLALLAATMFASFGVREVVDSRLALENQPGLPSSPSHAQVSGEPESDDPVVKVDESSLKMFAPYVTGGNALLESNPLLAPQTVGYVIGTLEEEAEQPVDLPETPSPWLGRVVEQSVSPGKEEEEEGEEKEEEKRTLQAPSDVMSLDFLVEYSPTDQSTAASGGEAVPRLMHIPSADAIWVARKLDGIEGAKRGVVKETAEKCVKRRFKSLPDPNRSQAVNTILQAGSLHSTVWDRKSRTLRAQVVLCELANDLHQLWKRGEAPLKAMKAALSAGTEEARKTAAVATQDYLRLLQREKLVLTSVQQFAALWKAEAETALTGVASLFSSSGFSLFDDLSKASTFFSKLQMLVKLKDAAPPELRGKNWVQVVASIAAAHLERVNYCLDHIDSLFSKDASTRLAEFKQKIAAAKIEAATALSKKKIETWMVDCF